jgi:hypothetical protein
MKSLQEDCNKYGTSEFELFIIQDNIVYAESNKIELDWTL